jgi:hypothetical protein
VHELEQLVDDGLEELPVSAEEFGVLADDVPVVVLVWGGGGFFLEGRRVSERCGERALAPFPLLLVEERKHHHPPTLT